MIGDGVNDVLSLKKANMGIAMESGSTATRAVAGMVLLGDSFEAMPKALLEGQRIVASIQSILKVYMVTVFALVLLITGISALQLGFPFTAPQNTILSFFARGAPPAIISLTALAVVNRGRLSTNIMHFTLPAALLMFVFGLLIYVGAIFVADRGLAQMDAGAEMMAIVAGAARVPVDSLSPERFALLATVYTAQTSLVTFFVLAGILTMVFAEPPLRWFAGGAPYRGHWLTGASAVALIVAYYILLLWPWPRAFFELVPLPLSFHIAILVMTAAWAFLLRTMWRRNWLGRFLDMPLGDVAASS
jgi:cation-transporting ATPase E